MVEAGAAHRKRKAQQAGQKGKQTIQQMFAATAAKKQKQWLSNMWEMLF